MRWLLELHHHAWSLEGNSVVVLFVLHDGVFLVDELKFEGVQNDGEDGPESVFCEGLSQANSLASQERNIGRRVSLLS